MMPGAVHLRSHRAFFMSLYLKTLIRTLAMTSVIAIGLGVLQLAGHSAWWHPAGWWLLLAVATSTLLTAWLTDYGIVQFRPQFHLFFLVGMLIRMFISVGVVGAVAYAQPDRLLALGLNFMTLYLSYLGFEIYSLVSNLRA